MSDDDIAGWLDDDPRRDASQAGLRYVELDEPGFSRHRWGRGFTYRDPAGMTVESGAQRRRFSALVIPPAWTDVWICDDELGHVQASGRDAAGRKQYLYHAAFQEIRSQRKYRRMLGLGGLLPRIREAVDRHLREPAHSRRRVLAGIVRLLQLTYARIGHPEYAEQHGTYGLTTLRKRHVSFREDGTVHLTFKGKHGQPWELIVDEADAIDVIRDGISLPGWNLFKFVEAGTKRDASASDVNLYLHEISGHDLMAKDFRTWAGCVLAFRHLRRAHAEGELHEDMDQAVRETVATVAEVLHNTPQVCRSAYISPNLLEPASVDVSDAPPSSRGLASRASIGLTRDERAALRALRDRYERCPPSCRPDTGDNAA